MTVRLGARRVCFQCRYSWLVKPSASAVPAPKVLVDKIDGYPFSIEELARLRIYRRAVRAGFFSDAL